MRRGVLMETQIMTKEQRKKCFEDVRAAFTIVMIETIAQCGYKTGTEATLVACSVPVTVLMSCCESKEERQVIAASLHEMIDRLAGMVK